MHPHSRRMQAVILFGNLVLSFSVALPAYVNSTFIKGIIGEQNVGYLYAVAAVLTIGILAASPRTLSRLGNRRFFLSYAAVAVASLALLVLPLHNAFVTVGAFVAFLVSASALTFSFNVFFEHVTDPASRGRMRGLYLLLANLGWLLTPLLTARIIDRFSYSGLYMVSLAILATLAVFMHIGLARYEDVKYAIRQQGFVLLRAIRKSRLRPVIISNFVLQFFYSWMVVYAPIYLSSHLGFSWGEIGLIFSVMLTPFVLLDYPLGWIADRLGSEKEFTTIGFAVMAVSAFGLALMHGHSLPVIAGLFFLSRVGAATVETMTEIHFFKIAVDTEPELLSVLSELPPLANIVAPLAGIVVITLCPFKTIFTILGFITLIGCYNALHIENTCKWWTRAHKKYT